MKLIKTMLVTTGVTTLIGYGVYRLMLTNEARGGIRNAATSVRDSYRRITEVISDITGITIEEDAEMPENAKATLREWGKLGF